ncbi:MAG: elongation factor G [Bacteroidales bacterium]|jgi:elongation factor G|nr:elongation factor G [Bacteroidales bacterium]MBR0123110.1 elongation factor G [Bacteroidales bacterium]
MKIYETSKIRNINLLGSAKVGKTTLSESMLLQGGVITRRGSVKDGNTVSDYREIELAKQNSVSSTVMCTEFKNFKINFIDNPGFVDYLGEIYASTKVTDAAFMVVNATEGTEVGTEIQWRMLAKYKTPVVFVLNQLDHEKANFEEVINGLKEDFGNNIVPLQFPISTGANFDSIVDILSNKVLKYGKDGGVASVEDVPANLADRVEESRNAIIEAAAEGDEALMEKFFEDGTLSPEDINKGLKLSIMNRDMFPLLCVSAEKNIGVDSMLDFIINNIPSPDQTAPVTTSAGVELHNSVNDPAAAFIFKTSIESHLGELSFFRVYGGEISEGQDVINANNDGKERISQVMVGSGKNRTKIAKVVAGDFGVTIKLKDARTNQTLVSNKTTVGFIPPFDIPEPIFSLSIKATNSSDDEKLGVALNDIQRVDPSIRAGFSRELRELVLSGLGEIHINTVKWYLNNLNKIEVDLYPSKIPYRETITKIADANYRHKKQSGGAGQFGEVHLRVQPYVENYEKPTDFPIRGTEEYNLDWGGKLIFNNCIVGGAIDARFMPAILKGIMERMEQGPLTGSYARDIVVYIYDGKMHPVDSNEMAFKLAGRNAFREAFKNAGPKIMEPIYDVEVLVPEDLMGGVMTDIQNRRGIVMGMDSEGHYQRIRAQVPLSEMNRYSTALSSLTSGRATYSMKYNEYRQVPPDVQDRLLKAYAETQTGEED